MALPPWQHHHHQRPRQLQEQESDLASPTEQNIDIKERISHVESPLNTPSSPTYPDIYPDSETESKSEAGSSVASTSSSNHISGSPNGSLATDDDFPDGGLQAWLNVLGCTFVSMTAFGQVNAFGVFQTYYAQNQLAHKSASDISWIGGVQIVLLYFSGIVLGGVFDVYGARGLLISGCLLSTFSFLMISLSHQYYQIFLSQAVGLGLGIALQFYPLLIVPAHWFRKRRAAALGIVVAGSSLGGIIFPIMLSRLFDILGFQWAVRAVALVVFVVQAASIPFIKERIRRPPRSSLSQGIECASSSSTSKGLEEGITDEKNPQVQQQSRRVSRWTKVPLMIDFGAFKDPRFAWHALGGFFSAFGLYTPFWYIELFSLSRGVDHSLAFYMIAIMNAAGVVGRVSSGYLADRFGRFNTLVPVALLQCLACFVVWSTANSLPHIIAFTIIFGFASASYSSVASSCVAQITPDPTQIGSRTGMFMLSMAPGILAGPPVSGAILAAMGASTSYEGVQAFCGAVMLAGALCAIVARRVCVGAWVTGGKV